MTEDSPRSRMVRAALLGVAGLSVAAASFVNSRISQTRDTAPDTALALAAHDSDALALKGDLLLAQNPDGAAVKEVGRLAESAVAARPINARAIRILGIVAQIEGNDAARDRDLALAARVSRRDLGVQLWQIERAVTAGDIPTVLQNYDIALRSNASSGPILYPILTTALDDPEIQRGFAPYIRQNPPWLATFLNDALINSKNPASILATIAAAGRLPDGMAFRDIEQKLVGHLASARQYNAARALYIQLRGTDPNAPTTAAFKPGTIDPRFRPISWQTINDSGVGAEFAPFAGGTSSLRIFADAGQSGPVAQKLLYMAPGNYRLSWRQSTDASNSGAKIGMDVSCVAGHTNMIAWQREVPITVGNQAMVADVTIPASCPVQMVTIRMAGGRGDMGMDVALTDLALTRQ